MIRKFALTKYERENLGQGVAAAIGICLLVATTGYAMENGLDEGVPDLYVKVGAGFCALAAIVLIGGPIWAIVEQRHRDRTSRHPLD